MREIILTRSHKAMVDDLLYDHLSTFNWCAKPNGRTVYAIRKESIAGKPGKQRTIYMHRYIASLLRSPDADTIDHFDGNGLNNCLSNLRPLTNRENSQHRVRLNKNNKSGFVGVTFNKNARKWTSGLVRNGHRVHFGYFSTADEASAARESYLQSLAPELSP